MDILMRRSLNADSLSLVLAREENEKMEGGKWKKENRK
jgi:hypothetical protein